jgi:hypothetical protein
MGRWHKKIILEIVLIGACLQPLYAQHTEEDEEEAKINSNLGFAINVPVASTADVIHTGWGIATGVGYNFDRRNALIGEFLWNRVYANSSQLQPLLAVAQGAGNLDGNSDLFFVGGSYRLELRGKLLGTYLIGGGGWYHRENNLSREVNAGIGTTCTTPWLWWGFSCSTGTVTANQTLASSSASSWGANGGVGATIRVGEAPYRLYFESRYHYSPSETIHIHFVQVTLGIRY